MLELGILDIGIVGSNDTSYTTIERMIEDVQTADSLGFSRYWLGEHNESNIAWRSPDVLIGILASITTNIRIGSAGVLLPLHSTLRVAENYRLLSALFPNRIDLGIASGYSDIEIVKLLINENDFNNNIKNHSNRVKTLHDYIKNGRYNDSAGFIPPNIIPEYEMWLLGMGGGRSASIANSIKSNYSLSLFHDGLDENKIKNVKEFRKNYFDTHGFMPKMNICCSVLQSSNKIETKDIKSICSEQHMIINIIGNMESIETQLLELAYTFDVKELIIVDVCNDSNKKSELLQFLSTNFLKYESTN